MPIIIMLTLLHCLREIGFAESAAYDDESIIKYNGKRVFVHPDYKFCFTFDEDGDIQAWNKHGDPNYQTVMLQIATTMIGMHVNYLTPFVEIGAKIRMYRPSEINIILKEEYGGYCAHMCMSICLNDNSPPRYVANFGTGIARCSPETIIDNLRICKPKVFALNELRRLRQENVALREQIKYMPGGDGFKEAKRHFSSAANQQKRQKPAKGKGKAMRYAKR